MKKHRYTLAELTVRLLKIAKPQAGMIFLSTIVSIIGNLSHMGLLGSGAAMILCAGGQLKTGSVGLWGCCMFGCTILIGLMRFFEGFASHVAAYELLAMLRTSLYHKLRELSPACLIERHKGDIISTAISDIDMIENFFAHSIGPMFTVILLPLTALVCAAKVHPMFALVLLPVYIMISIVIPLAALKSGRNLGARYRGQLGGMKNLILESVYGLRDIQIYQNGENRLKQVDAQSIAMNHTAHSMALHRQAVTALPSFFIYLSRIVIIATTGALALKDTADLNGVIILSMIVSASFSSTQSLISVVSSLIETYAAASRLFDVMDEEPAVKDITQEEGNQELKEYILDTVKSIEMKNVSFRYRTDKQLVLDHMNLKIRSGDKIGIMGASGAGKSTILRLLLRFWDPTEGSVMLNDRDLKQIPLSNLREKVALVEQQTFIYDDTVAANIALGRPEATMEEIRKAAKRAGIDSLINRLPDGYETRLGEFGGRLSGGERQRIAIARVMLMNADVLVMDEPTSNLDIFHEKQMLKTLREEYADKTVIIVSHRKSTLMDCTEIYEI